MFIGITVLADAYHIIPDGSAEPETANSQLARAIFGSGSPFYYILQVATMLILVKVVSQDDYRAWVAQQQAKPSASPSAAAAASPSASPASGGRTASPSPSPSR